MEQALVIFINTSSLIAHYSYRNPTDRELATAFDVYFPSYTDLEATTPLKQIKRILDKKNRYLLTVCCFDRDSNVVKTIFNAILSGIIQKNIISSIPLTFFTLYSETDR